MRGTEPGGCKMRMQALLVGVLMAISTKAHCLIYAHIETLVELADYVVVGKVVKVAIDQDGHEISSPDVLTGPGFTMRLYIAVDHGSVLKGDRKKLPKELVVIQKAGWPWPETIKATKERTAGKKFIFLLNDKHFAPISDTQSYQSMSEKKSIVKLVKQGPPKREPQTRTFSSGSH